MCGRALWSHKAGLSSCLDVGGRWDASKIMPEAQSLSKQVKWACSGPERGGSVRSIVGGGDGGLISKYCEFYIARGSTWWKCPAGI